jgi:hypothetical protein
MTCVSIMSECGETFAGRGFETIRIQYPRLMSATNSSQISVSQNGFEFGTPKKMQI